MSSGIIEDSFVQEKRILTKQILDSMKETTRDLGYIKNSIENQLKFMSNFLVVPDKERNNPNLSSNLKGYFEFNRDNASFNWKIYGDSLLARYINAIYNSYTTRVSLNYDNKGIHVSILSSIIASDPLCLKLASDKEMEMLKFLPRKTLCFIIRYIISHLKKYNDKTEVSLDATPTMSSGGFKDPKKLFYYYYELGFVLADERSKDNYVNYITENINYSITMISNLKTIQNTCSSFDIDKSIVEIIDNVKPITQVVIESKKEEIQEQDQDDNEEYEEDDSFEGMMKMNELISTKNLFKEKKETLERAWKNILNVKSKYTDQINSKFQNLLERRRKDNPYYNAQRDDYKFERMMMKMF